MKQPSPPPFLPTRVNTVVHRRHAEAMSQTAVDEMVERTLGRMLGELCLAEAKINAKPDPVTCGTHYWAEVVFVDPDRLHRYIAGLVDWYDAREAELVEDLMTANAENRECRAVIQRLLAHIERLEGQSRDDS
jgi:chorismate mutase